MQHHHYGLTEIEMMMPWEREVYLTMLIQHMSEEEEKAKANQQKR